MSQSRNRPSKAPHKAGGVATNAQALAQSIVSESQPEGGAPGSSGNVELENQFILRLPSEPAAALREALRSGAGNIKERLSIQMEPETHTNDPRLRKGIVEFDGWNMTAKVLDLPSIIESQKTIDRKTFYKTADISQIVICREGEASDEDEPLLKPKKYDPNKVDKKFLYPHGVCPPLKNCRKRRFRKTLKKKYIEAPEIEKEVRRLFRVDNEAESVKWELLTEEQLNAERPIKSRKNLPPGAQSVRMATGDDYTYDEQDLFGALSDSDEDAETRESGHDSSRGNASQSRIDVDDSEGDTSFGQPGSASFQVGNDETSISQMVQGDSMQNSFDSSEHHLQVPPSYQQLQQQQQEAIISDQASSQNIFGQGGGPPTSFSRDMFPQPNNDPGTDGRAPGPEVGNVGGENAVALKMEKISLEIAQLQRQRREVHANIASGANNNAALLQRFRATLAQLDKDIEDREAEQDAFSMFN